MPLPTALSPGRLKNKKGGKAKKSTAKNTNAKESGRPGGAKRPLGGLLLFVIGYQLLVRSAYQVNSENRLILQILLILSKNIMIPASV